MAGPDKITDDERANLNKRDVNRRTIKLLNEALGEEEAAKILRPVLADKREKLEKTLGRLKEIGLNTKAQVTKAIRSYEESGAGDREDFQDALIEYTEVAEENVLRVRGATEEVLGLTSTSAPEPEPKPEPEPAKKTIPPLPPAPEPPTTPEKVKKEWKISIGGRNYEINIGPQTSAVLRQIQDDLNEKPECEKLEDIKVKLLEIKGNYDKRGTTDLWAEIDPIVDEIVEHLDKRKIFEQGAESFLTNDGENTLKNIKQKALAGELNDDDPEAILDDIDELKNKLVTNRFGSKPNTLETLKAIGEGTVEINTWIDAGHEAAEILLGKGDAIALTEVSKRFDALAKMDTEADGTTEIIIENRAFLNTFKSTNPQIENRTRRMHSLMNRQTAFEYTLPADAKQGTDLIDALSNPADQETLEAIKSLMQNTPKAGTNLEKDTQQFFIHFTASALPIGILEELNYSKEQILSMKSTERMRVINSRKPQAKKIARKLINSLPEPYKADLENEKTREERERKELERIAKEAVKQKAKEKADALKTGEQKADAVAELITAVRDTEIKRILQEMEAILRSKPDAADAEIVAMKKELSAEIPVLVQTILIDAAEGEASKISTETALEIISGLDRAKKRGLVTIVRNRITALGGETFETELSEVKAALEQKEKEGKEKEAREKNAPNADEAQKMLPLLIGLFAPDSPEASLLKGLQRLMKTEADKWLNLGQSLMHQAIKPLTKSDVAGNTYKGYFVEKGNDYIVAQEKLLLLEHLNSGGRKTVLPAIAKALKTSDDYENLEQAILELEQADQKKEEERKVVEESNRPKQSEAIELFDLLANMEGVDEGDKMVLRAILRLMNAGESKVKTALLSSFAAPLLKQTVAVLKAEHLEDDDALRRILNTEGGVDYIKAADKINLLKGLDFAEEGDEAVLEVLARLTGEKLIGPLKAMVETTIELIEDEDEERDRRERATAVLTNRPQTTTQVRNSVLPSLLSLSLPTPIQKVLSSIQKLVDPSYNLPREEKRQLLELVGNLLRDGVGALDADNIDDLASKEVFEKAGEPDMISMIDKLNIFNNLNSAGRVKMITAMEIAIEEPSDAIKAAIDKVDQTARENAAKADTAQQAAFYATIKLATPEKSDLEEVFEALWLIHNSAVPPEISIPSQTTVDLTTFLEITLPQEIALKLGADELESFDEKLKRIQGAKPAELTVFLEEMIEDKLRAHSTVIKEVIEAAVGVKEKSINSTNKPNDTEINTFINDLLITEVNDPKITENLYAIEHILDSSNGFDADVVKFFKDFRWQGLPNKALEKLGGRQNTLRKTAFTTKETAITEAQQNNPNQLKIAIKKTFSGLRGENLKALNMAKENLLEHEARNNPLLFNDINTFMERVNPSKKREELKIVMRIITDKQYLSPDTATANAAGTEVIQWINETLPTIILERLRTPENKIKGMTPKVKFESINNRTMGPGDNKTINDAIETAFYQLDSNTRRLITDAAKKAPKYETLGAKGQEYEKRVDDMTESVRVWVRDHSSLDESTQTKIHSHLQQIWEGMPNRLSKVNPNTEATREDVLKRFEKDFENMTNGTIPKTEIEVNLKRKINLFALL